MRFIVVAVLVAPAFAVIAPIFESFSSSLIPNEFIVTLRKPSQLSFQTVDGVFVDDEDYSEYVDAHIANVFGQSIAESTPIIHKYHLGYAAKFNQELLQEVRQMAEVEFIEANAVVSIHSTDGEPRTQKNPANWGLDRISHRKLPLAKEYLYSEVGSGVDVYVIDSGISITHVDFGGRAVWGLTAPDGDDDKDGNGHGTHVSSTIGGTKYGVAKNATLIAVKVIRSSGYGTTADVIEGVEWTAEEHMRKLREGKKVKSLANMSLGGGSSYALYRAVQWAIEKGVSFAVAAGNANDDACDSTPADVETAVTVGATDKYDARAYFSNYGKCVDIFAPGHLITAAWIGSDKARRTISGTSMASPHVCGVMALLLGQGDYTPKQLKQKILDLATKNILTDVGTGSPNLNLFSSPEKFARKPDSDMSDIIESLRYQK
eukprot:Partr_v1_DN27375_c3_g1_i2_m45995 putative Serine protease